MTFDNRPPDGPEVPLLLPEVIVEALSQMNASYVVEKGTSRDLASLFHSSRTLSAEEQGCLPDSNGVIYAVNVPSLSLQHEEHSPFTRSDRKQVEEYAATLLARPLRKSGQTSIVSTKEFSSVDLQDVPDRLLNNVNESFATLVDCRLRAYAVFLARHGIALAKETEADGVVSIEHKLTALLEIGGRIEVKAITLEFKVDEVGVDPTENNSATPLSLHVQMDLHIPNGTGSQSSINVAIQAPGSAQVACASDCEQPVLTIQLETRPLLNDMILQASRVVAVVVDIANTSSIVPESKLSRSYSFLAMPPPKPQAKAAQALEMLSAAAAAEEPMVVSPDMRSLVSPLVPRFPNFDLSSEDEAADVEQDLSELSPDECANIVDGIFGFFDESILGHQPSKKQKL